MPMIWLESTKNTKNKNMKNLEKNVIKRLNKFRHYKK